MPGPTTYSCQPFDQVKMEGWCLNGIPYCECVDLSAFDTGTATCAEDADHQETITVAGI